MKLESKVKVNVRNRIFGGEKTLACIPMVAVTREALLKEADICASMNPDIIEWRVDSFELAGDAEATSRTLVEMAPLLNGIPIIFTFRIAREGGAKEYTQEERLATIKACLETSYADVIDIEACNEPEFIAAVKETVVANNSRLIISAHNFKSTPSEEEMIAILEHEQELGADIPKLAVMPQSFDDVLALMRATYRARTGNVIQPMITMSMAEVGKISRVIGNLYGSDLSFVVGQNASAPGQIPMNTARELWTLL